MIIWKIKRNFSGGAIRTVKSLKNKFVKSRMLAAISVTIGVNIGVVLFDGTFSFWKSILFAVVYYGVDSIFSVLRNKSIST